MSNVLTLTLRSYLKNYNGLTLHCWLGIFLIFIDSIAGGICFFFSLYFVNYLHFSIATSGLLMSLYGLGTVVGGVIGGKLSDNISPKLLSILSLLIQAFSFLIIIKLHAVTGLLFILFIMGIAAYTFKTAINCWMLNQSDYNSEIILKTLNIARVASNLGLALSGVIVGLIATKNFPMIFLLSSTLFFIGTFCLTLQIDEKSTSKKANLYTSPTPIHYHNNQKIIFLTLICVFLIGLTIAQLSTTYPIYIQNSFKELGIKAVSILFILDTILIVVFQAPLVNYLKKYNNVVMLGMGAFLMGLGMLVLSVATAFNIAILSCVLWATGEMIFIPFAQLLCYKNGVEKKKGQIIGIYQAVYATSTISGPILGGILYYHVDGQLLWCLCGVIGVGCMIACVSYCKKFQIKY